MSIYPIQGYSYVSSNKYILPRGEIFHYLRTRWSYRSYLSTLVIWYNDDETCFIFSYEHDNNLYVLEPNEMPWSDMDDLVSLFEETPLLDISLPKNLEQKEV